MRTRKRDKLSKLLSPGRHLRLAKKCGIYAYAFAKLADETPEDRDFIILVHRAAACLQQYHATCAHLVELAGEDPEYRDALAELCAGTPEPLPLFEVATT